MSKIKKYLAKTERSLNAIKNYKLFV